MFLQNFGWLSNDYTALMLFIGMIAVYCENRTKHVNTSCGQNSESVNAKAHGTSLTEAVTHPFQLHTRSRLLRSFLKLAELQTLLKIK
jgi:hypothetical protein